MEQASLLCGGMSLLHTMVDGKHHYEVINVLTRIQSSFARKGDTLLMINDVETQNLPPDQFVNMLRLGSPMLTIHQACTEADKSKFLESDFICPYRKEQTTMTFNMAMVTEECLDQDEENASEPDVCEWASDDVEEDQALLLVAMNKTTMTLVRGRGCDSENSCNNCCTSGCNFNEVIVTAEASEVTSVCREYIKKCAERRLWMNLVRTNLPEGASPFACSEPVSEDVTIYRYISNIIPDLGRGVPVVINLTGSNNYLKCTCENQKVVLKWECCEKKLQLKKICKDNKDWPLVFYMTEAKDKTRHFESAAHKGWFIQTTKPKICVSMEHSTEETRKNFYFLIYYKSSSQ